MNFNLHERMIPGVKLPGSLAVSLVAIVIASTLVIGSALLITRSLSESSVQAKEADVIEGLLSSNRMMDDAEERFNGRSIFYIPREPVRRRPAPPPPRVPERRPEPEPEPVREPAPIPPPSSYAGPDIQSILGNEVFFTNGKRVPVGQAADGVEVIRIHTPFKVKLGWRSGEYDVELFAQEMPSFFGEQPFGVRRKTDLASDGSSTTFRSQTTDSQGSSRESTSSSSRTIPSGSGSNVVPEPLTDEQLKALTRSEITKRIGDVFRGMRAKDIDPETKAKLEEERKTLMQMLRESSSNEEK